MKATKQAVPIRCINAAVIAAIAALIGAIMLMATVPPVDRDGLSHHLAVPKLYLKNGGIHEIPGVPFSYYPMNLDLLYMIPLYFGNDILPKFMHFGFALLTGWLIFIYLRRRLDGRHYGLAGALLFLSLPIVVKLSITVYVDLGLIFFSTAALLQLLRWAETNFRPRHLVLAGVFAGLCLGTKINGMLAVFLMALGVLFIYRRLFIMVSQSDHKAAPEPGGEGVGLKPLGWAMVFVAVAALVYSPWMVRNALWTGNPVYPMAAKLLGPDRPPDDRAAISLDEGGATAANDGPQQASGFSHFAVRKVVFGESLWEILLIPIRVFIQGQDDDPRLFDGRLNPYLLIFPLLAVLPLKGRRRSPRLEMEVRLMSLFAVGYLVFAFFLVDMRIRYIGPIIPPLTILAVVGINDLIGAVRTRCSPRGRLLGFGATAAVFVFLLVLNGTYLTGQFALVDPLSYLQGKVSRDEYILKFRPEYAALSFANRSLPAEARILGLFNGNRIYYSEREMICDNEAFRRAVLASKSSQDLVRRLERDRISHVLVRVDLFHQWAESQFRPSEKVLLQSFFAEKLRRLYQGHGYTLFAVPAG
jgi:hypothetical protein